MGKTGRLYSPEFKEEAIRLVHSSEEKYDGAISRPGSLAVAGPLPGGHLPRSGIERNHPRGGRRRFPGVQPVRGRRGGGENLGYLFTGLWTALVALAMFGSGLPFRRWLVLLGVVAAAAILVGTLEAVGFEPAANIVVVGYILWSIWLALFGIFLLLPRSIRHRALQVNPAGKATTRIGETVERSNRGR